LPHQYFINRCLHETLAGLRAGLSNFSGTSRTAVIFCIHAEDDLYICDPQNLLRGYEPKLRALYYEREKWCTPSFGGTCFTYNYIEPQTDIHLDGLISYGGSSNPVYYQMWFTEHHPNICSVHPTECWLEHAVLRFSHDMANESELYTGISGSFLREYAMYAVHDCVLDKAGAVLGLDIRIQIYPILESILGISKTNEEGVRPYGSIIFAEDRFFDKLSFLTKIRRAERPHLNNSKHVRKLLQAVEHSERSLVSNGNTIVGIADQNIAPFYLKADFHGKFGFLSVNEEKICSFQDGTYSSNTHRAKLFEVEEALLDFAMEASVRNDLFRIIANLVHNAEDNKFGCTFVIDLADTITATAGQELCPPINLQESSKLQLAQGLSKVDGALHIREDLHLYAFACLLDGPQVPNENRARGARYNSALRFTAQHRQTIVVVVSSDRPVSIFQQGKEIVNKSTVTSTTRCNLFPLPLAEWLETAE